MIAGYAHFLRLARRLQWDADAIDLSCDAAAWPQLDPPLRRRLEVLLAGFCVGEASVAEELAPFAGATGDPDAAACFEAQAGDERRHARFFDRVAGEVMGAEGATPGQRRAALRERLDPRFVELFERRLPAVADSLARGETRLEDAVGLYHMVLEGVVFTAGQFAVLELLEEDRPLPGVREGVELVLRDERWHVGLGTRCLHDARIGPDLAARILREGEAAASAWTEITGAEIHARVTAIHHRRLGAVRAAEASLS